MNRKFYFFQYAKAILVASIFFSMEVSLFQWTKQELPFMALAIALVASNLGLGPALAISFIAIYCEAYFLIEPYDSISVGGTLGMIKILIYSSIAIFMSVYLGRQKKLNQELQNLVESQKKWVANLSHEIRTPLHGILGLNRLLMDSNSNPTDQKYLKLIQSSTERLMGLVSDLLDFSTLQAQKMKFESRSFDPEKELEDVLQILSAKAKEKNISFDVKLSGIHQMIIGDAGKFSQILINLIDNAIKYSSSPGAGVVEISLRSLDAGFGFQKIELKVKDYGVGISELDQKSLSKAFFRSLNPKTHSVGGSGLGLSIVKALVDAMKGQMKVESQLGQGSIFTVSLKFPQATEHKPVEPEMSFVQNMKSQRVLLAEDNEVNQIILKDYLVRLGHQVDVVSDGASALSLAESYKYPLLIFDKSMPVIDGFKAAEHIRSKYEQQGFFDFKMIAVTADASKECQSEAKISGIDQTLTKPIDFSTFKKAVLEIQNPWSGMIDKFDAKLVQEMLSVFFDQAKSRSKSLKDSMIRKSFTELKDISHLLKSSYLAIGDRSAAKLCQALEDSALDQDVEQCQKLVDSLCAKLDHSRSEIEVHLSSI